MVPIASEMKKWEGIMNNVCEVIGSNPGKVGQLSICTKPI